jgi:hypothetical protein
MLIYPDYIIKQGKRVLKHQIVPCIHIQLLCIKTKKQKQHRTKPTYKSPQPARSGRATLLGL